MTNQPNKRHRKSIRLKGYDYSQPGYYFITICVQNRLCLFGHIKNGEMILNDAGRMIEKWYAELENKFPGIKCHNMVVMPNHFHCVVQIVGADPRVRPLMRESALSNESALRNETPLTTQTPSKTQTPSPPINQPPVAPKNAHECSQLSRAVQWFKTMTTNEYIRGVKELGWKPFQGKLWQRNYWEHIIRNQQAYHRIIQYINNNPKNWNKDKLHHKK